MKFVILWLDCPHGIMWSKIEFYAYNYERNRLIMQTTCGVFRIMRDIMHSYAAKFGACHSQTAAVRIPWDMTRTLWLSAAVCARLVCTAAGTPMHGMATKLSRLTCVHVLKLIMQPGIDHALNFFMSINIQYYAKICRKHCEYVVKPSIHGKFCIRIIT